MSGDRAKREKRSRAAHLLLENCAYRWLRHFIIAPIVCCAPIRASAEMSATDVSSLPAAHTAAVDAEASSQAVPHTALWPFSRSRPRAIFDSAGCAVTPHPAVARIVVPEQSATAFGSGTLVDVRDQYGLVVTNWHVVRDSQGVVEVRFPNGFRSHARPLKVDSEWDLAALVIWRPPIEPVQLASQPPRPGDLLTIHGYGQGQYRIATGRCTTYYAPRRDYPLEMVELDVEARQGDSGGPIFNQNGELAGVLFGAGQGTTLGSFAPRVSNFLATLAPDIGHEQGQSQVAIADRPAPDVRPAADSEWKAAQPNWPSSPWSPQNAARQVTSAADDSSSSPTTKNEAVNASATANEELLAWSDVTGTSWYDPLKSALALVGLVAVASQLVKVVR
jgi:S1-C subfamily serine protease